MWVHQISDPSKLVAYITDCTLATVASLRMTRSASKNETKRQIAIAQVAVNKGRQMGVNFSTTRAADVIENFDGDCSKWAEQYAPPPKRDKR
jgi:hypothetical protein